VALTQLFSTEDGNPVAVSAAAGTGSVFMAETVGAAAGEGVDGEIVLYNQAASAFVTRWRFDLTMTASDGSLARIVGAGRRDTAADVDAIRLFFDNAGAVDIAEGAWAVYGFR
jgi:hypothetical protein